jgi:HTH-type transcriptional regulator, quorum sensing regulator NprR
MTIQTNIGEKIRHLRIHKQLSQTELVEGICSVAYLSKVENGKAKPSKAFLQQVSERLNVSFDMIENPSSDSFNQKLETSLASIEAEKRTLTDEEESLLKMAFIEFVQPLLLVRVVTALLRNALDKHLLQEADAVYEASIKLIDMTITFSSEEETEKRIYFNLHNAIGRYFYRNGDFNKADYHFSVGERLIINPYTLESAIIYNNLSLVKQRVLEDKTLALFYSEKAYEIFKKHQDLPNLIDILITIGVQYHITEQYEKSLQALQEAEGYVEQTALPNKDSLFIMIRYNIGRVYQKLVKFEKAIMYYNECLQITIDDTYKVYVLKGLLEIKLQLKEWEALKRLLDEALLLTQQHRMASVEVELHWIKANIFKERGDDFNYEKYIKGAIEKAESIGFQLIVKGMAKELGDYYYDYRFYKKAAKYYALALSSA